jgi:hypothetical protein
MAAKIARIRSAPTAWPSMRGSCKAANRAKNTTVSNHRTPRRIITTFVAPLKKGLLFSVRAMRISNSIPRMNVAPAIARLVSHHRQPCGARMSGMADYKFGGRHSSTCLCPTCQRYGGNHYSHCTCPSCQMHGGKHYSTCTCPACGQTGGKHSSSCVCPVCNTRG